MKFQTINDTVVDTISNDMKLPDVINAKIKSIELEVCFMFPVHQTRRLHSSRVTYGRIFDIDRPVQGEMELEKKHCSTYISSHASTGAVFILKLFWFTYIKHALDAELFSAFGRALTKLCKWMFLKH